MSIKIVSPFQTIQQVPMMGYVSYSVLDQRFKMIYKHLNNESAPLALHFIGETIDQIIAAKACDCDINFISHVLISLLSVYSEVLNDRVHNAHNIIREMHYTIDNMFDV